MGSMPPFLSFLLMVVSGWVYRHQLIVIEFLQTENRLLSERLWGKRIRFTDAEWARLARRAKAVGRKALLQLDTSFHLTRCYAGTDDGSRRNLILRIGEDLAGQGSCARSRR